MIKFEESFKSYSGYTKITAKIFNGPIFNVFSVIFNSLVHITPKSKKRIFMNVFMWVGTGLTDSDYILGKHLDNILDTEKSKIFGNGALPEVCTFWLFFEMLLISEGYFHEKELQIVM